MILLTKKVDAMVSMELISAFCERNLLGVVVCATFLQDSAEDLLSSNRLGVYMNQTYRHTCLICRDRISGFIQSNKSVDI